MKIVDITDLVDDGKQRTRSFSKIKFLVVHRVGRILNRAGHVVSSLGRTAEEICDAFLHDPAVSKYTGGEIAYTFIIEEDGTIKQCLPIDEVGAHAKRWNVPGIGIACVGDFRYEHPNEPQYNALIDLLAELSRAWAFDPRDVIRGHTELPNSTSSAGKDCPGDMIAYGTGDTHGMEDVREEVVRIMKDTARLRLTGDGLVWTD